MFTDRVRKSKSQIGTKKGIADEISGKKEQVSIIHSCLVFYMSLHWYNRKDIWHLNICVHTWSKEEYIPPLICTSNQNGSRENQISRCAS